MTKPVHIIACGALVRELTRVVRANGFEHVTVECIPGELHNRPDRIPDAIERRLDAWLAADDRSEATLLIGYADCGTGGKIDEICHRYGAERLPGPHCYEFYAGADVFAGLHDAEPGTLYLTDYLARYFDAVVWRPLGLDRHPELRDAYFGNYRRVVHLAQADDQTLRAAAKDAAERLGLDFEHRHTGLGELGSTVVALATAS